MHCISEQQTEYILSDIRRRGVEMEDLQYNLLDHVCCIVEQNLKEGDDFESFYQKTITQFFKNELWEIEEETITLLTFKNYYAMKKTMIVSGATSVVLLLAGSLFKIMHWPGASPLLLLGIVTMSFLFLPLIFLLKTRETNSGRDKLITGLGALMGILLCMATLFKVFHWPGSGVLWILTSAVSIFVFIPVYFFTGIRKPETKVNTIVTSVILIGGTGLLFTLTSLKPGRPLEFYTFAANQDIVATRNYATEQNNIRYDILLSDSTSAKKDITNELRQRTNDLFRKIEKIKLDLVNSVEETASSEVDYTKLFSPNISYYDYHSEILFDHLGQPSAAITAMKNDINSFNTFIKTNYNKNSFGMINTSGTINTNTDGREIPWEVFNFDQVSFGSVIRNLTQIQLDIRIVEGNCIR
ncbi:MAG TPA: hypothetical protein VNZ49_02755 [Bacteroidia bacterium]|jgi:hypothetical protein|nr:hypothetical protein [Bacteroidia bacterium]